MSNRRRYAVDPTVQGGPTPEPQGYYNQGQSGQSQQQQQQPGYQQDINNSGSYPQQFSSPAQGQNAYVQATQKKSRVWDEDLLPPPPPFVPGHSDSSFSSPFGGPSGLVQPNPQQPELISRSATHSPLPPTNSIPQPPHAAGPSIKGPKPRIDPTQVPSPIEVAEMDQNLMDREDWESGNSRGIVPLGSTDYRGVDQGNSIPRYIRSTLTHIPTTASLLETTQLPLGLIINPFSNPRFDEEPIPLVTGFMDVEGNGTGNGSGAGLGGVEGEDVDPNAGGPVRCNKCRGYVNPWCRFVDGGVKWVCNLCNGTNVVPGHYLSHLDSHGNRMDLQSHPELTHGTVDYPVPRAYWASNPSSLLDAGGLSNVGSDLLGALNDAVGGVAESSGAREVLTGGSSTPRSTKMGGDKRKKETTSGDVNARRPAPIARVFMVDVSWSAVKGGIVREVCQGIKEAIYGKPKEQGLDRLNGDEQEVEEDEWKVPQGRIGIVTFDRAVHYYNLSAELETAQMMVVPDLEDMFVPLHRGFLVDPIRSRKQIEGLLDLIPRLYAETTCSEVALGAALKGLLAGLGGCGGQASIFLSSLPNHGPGLLKPREDPLIYGTDKEKTLFSPADGFWRNTAEQLAEAGVGCNLWLFPERFVDVGSVGVISSVTAGNVYFHPRFDPGRDRDAVHEEIRRIVGQEVVYNTTLRVRCSNNLRVASYTGNYYQRSLTDLEFGTMDSFQAFGATLKYDNKLEDKQVSYVQVAVLYTTASGERRVRVLNLSLPATNHIGNVFRFADFDTSVVMLLKEAVTLALTKNLPDVRRGLTERCAAILHAYRKHCAAGQNSGQLILPEVFKLLPLFTLCMLKCKALKGGHVASDVRALYLRALRSMPLPATSAFLYPRMFAIHDLPEKVGYAGENGRLELPTYIRCSHGWMTADGAYILTNGEIAFLWLGAAVSPQILNDLYGVENLDEIDIRITSLPKLPTYLSTQVRNIVAHHARLMNHELPVVIARQNMDGTEVEFANMLVEDSNNDALSYTDYIMSVHKTINDELNGGGKGTGWFS